MSCSSFDEQSSRRIGKAVVSVERGLPTPSGHARRALTMEKASSLQLVRLLTDIPAATIQSASRAKDFYDQLADFSQRIGATPGEPLRDESYRVFLSQLEGSNDFDPVYSFGTGRAVLCTIESETESNDLGTANVANVTYGDIVQVWNAHASEFVAPFFIDLDPIPATYAGSLGGGFCNAIDGPDGRLWLLSPNLIYDPIS